jgi:hypothetical protein
MTAKRVLMLGVLLIFSGCARNAQPVNDSIVALDQVNNQVHEVSANRILSTQGIPTEDMAGIRSALSRTPNVEYEILSVETFPPPPYPFPVAASVKVRHFYVYLCKGTTDQWHVFRIARYEN